MNVAAKLSESLAQVMSRAWWMLLLRGLAAFGLLVLTRPGISLASLVLFFGVYSLVNGVLGFFSAIFGKPDAENRWLLVGGALVSVAIGLLTLYAPGLTALALLFYISVWAISTGMLEVAAAFRLRREIQGEWMLALAGVVSIAFGIFLLARPGAGVLAVLSILAFFAILVGLLQVMLAFKVKGIASKLAAKAA
jgi:uncharacterized membrane protein HdeD (DUF308 family)